jgi:hypothetical protein
MRKLTVSNPAFVPRHTFLMQNGKFACSLEFEVSPGTLCLRSIRPAIDTMSNASDTTILSLVMSEQFCTTAQASCQHVSYSLLSRSSKRCESRSFATSHPHLDDKKDYKPVTKDYKPTRTPCLCPHSVYNDTLASRDNTITDVAMARRDSAKLHKTTHYTRNGKL